MGKGKGGFGSVPPRVTKKMSLMYLQSFYKFLDKAYQEDNSVTVFDLMIEVKKTLEDEGIYL